MEALAPPHAPLSGPPGTLKGYYKPPKMGRVSGHVRHALLPFEERLPPPASANGHAYSVVPVEAHARPVERV